MKRREVQLTVVIPVRNRRDLVADVLESLEGQVDKAFKLILVDNGSTDGTREFLTEWASVRREFETTVLSEPEPGASRARQKGLEGVDTPWTLFFDSDDVMHPDHIGRALEFVERHPDAELVGWDVRYEPGGRHLPFIVHNGLWHCLMHGTLSTQRYFARTELFRRAGGWNGNIGLWDDIELGLRLLKQNPKVYKIKGKPTATLRYTAESMSGPTFSAMVPRMEPALGAMERTLGPELGPEWTDFKRLQLLSAAVREGDGSLKSVIDRVISRQRPGKIRNLMCLYARLTCAGVRGLAYVLAPFVKHIRKKV